MERGVIFVKYIVAAIIAFLFLFFPAPAESSTTSIDQLKSKVHERIFIANFCREMEVESTAYSHTGNQTYTGTWPKEGRTVAVDPETIPMGSRLFVDGFGWHVAEDKIPPRSVRKGAKLDIFMDDKDECWNWGRRDVRIIIYPPRDQ